MRNLRIGVLSAAAALCLGASARGQVDVLNEYYGRGYHAYFRSDLVTAEEALNVCIAEGSKDPRAYYYRGLTQLALGRITEADVDFQEGAALEAAGHGRRIGQALERIQGAVRYQIEKARLQARLELARSRGFAHPAPDVPRELPPVPHDEHQAPVEPVDATPPVQHEVAPTTETPAETPAEDPAEAPAESPADMPAEEAPADDVFGDAPTTDEEATPPAEVTDPALDAPAAAEDPFGEMTTEEPAAETQP